MKRQVALQVHPGSWYFFLVAEHSGEWDWAWTFLCFTLEVRWPPKHIAVAPPPPLYAESTMQTHFTRKQGPI